MANSFKNYLESQGKSKSTIKHYSTYALDFLAWLDRDNTEIENATAKEVLSYLNHLQKKGNENQTRNIRLNVIKHFFNFQIEHGHRTDNPAQHMKIRGSKTKKLYPILDKQQLQKLYDSYQIPEEDHPDHKRNWFNSYRIGKERNKAIISLMINQGLTTAEVNKIQTGDLRLKEGTVYIAGSRKSNERTLELKSNQIMELMEYSYQIRPKLLEYQQDQTIQNLFLSTPVVGRKAAAGTLHVWKRLSEEIRETNKDFINFKQVRTSVITHWLKEFNLRQVQYMAGHRYVNTTESYLVNQTEDLQADIDQFYPF